MTQVLMTLVSKRDKIAQKKNRLTQSHNSRSKILLNKWNLATR